MPSKPGFNSHWFSHETLVTAGTTSGQNCSHAPVKSYIGTSVGTSEPLNKAVNEFRFGRYKGGMVWYGIVEFNVPLDTV